MPAHSTGAIHRTRPVRILTIAALTALALSLPAGPLAAEEKTDAGKTACVKDLAAAGTAAMNGADRNVPPGTWRIPPRLLPPPAGASRELQAIIRESKQPTIAEVLAMVPKSREGWKKLQAALDAQPAANAPKLAKALGVTITPDTIAGVKVFRLTPAKVDPAHRNHLFVHVHGGAYVLNAGLAGQTEAIMIAAKAGIPVISIDYRMPPDHPFPAALEDVTAVWQALVKTHDPATLAMGGTSAGAGLSMAALIHFRSQGLPMPAALFLGTPWADLTETGDSFFINEGIDRTLVTWKGILENAARLYADGRDLKEPLLSPLYGDLSGFPPTLLFTGTRDLFLSLTARAHRRLRDAGVPADLHVFEGFSHGEYISLRDTPESKAAYRELAAFLKRHLK